MSTLGGKIIHSSAIQLYEEAVGCCKVVLISMCQPLVKIYCWFCLIFKLLMLFSFVIMFCVKLFCYINADIIVTLYHLMTFNLILSKLLDGIHLVSLKNTNNNTKSKTMTIETILNIMLHFNTLCQ